MVVPTIVQAELKYFIMVNGERFVTMTGSSETVMLFVDNLVLASLKMQTVVHALEEEAVGFGWMNFDAQDVRVNWRTVSLTVGVSMTVVMEKMLPLSALVGACVHIYTQTHTGTHACTHTQACTCIHTYTQHTYIHGHPHTIMHTNTQVSDMQGLKGPVMEVNDHKKEQSSNSW